MTVFDLARKIGVNPLTVRIWERGLATPSPKNQEALAKLFGEPWAALAREGRREVRA